MKKIQDFTGFLLESQENYRYVADLIQKAVGGLGTDEKLLSQAIRSIKDGKTLDGINEIMLKNPKYSYRSIDDAIKGELGFFDGMYKKIIADHLKKIPAAEKKVVIPQPTEKKELDIITQIIPRVKQHEGVKPKKYLDSKGIPTIGVGFNLNRKDSDEILKSIGVNPVKIKSGKQELTQKQMDDLLIKDLKNSKNSAERIIGDLSQHPAGVQGVLIEMTFNLGATGISKFKNFIQQIKNKKYKEASAEMLNSKWSKQVGNRAKTLSDIIAKS